jgi:hypothetical protein
MGNREALSTLVLPHSSAFSNQIVVEESTAVGPDMVVHIYNPSYLGRGGKRIMV